MVFAYIFNVWKLDEKILIISKFSEDILIFLIKIKLLLISVESGNHRKTIVKVETISKSNFLRVP